MYVFVTLYMYMYVFVFVHVCVCMYIFDCLYMCNTGDESEVYNMQRTTCTCIRQELILVGSSIFVHVSVYLLEVISVDI